MNFRTTSTIEEQMNHVKKYAPLLLLNIPRKYQYGTMSRFKTT